MSESRSMRPVFQPDGNGTRIDNKTQVYLNEEVNQLKAPAPIAYDADNPNTGVKGKGLGSTGILGMVLPIGLAVAISFVLIGVLAPTKTQYIKDITRLETDMVKMRTDLKTADTTAGLAKDAADKANTTAGKSMIKEDALKTFATITDLGSVKSSLTSLNSTVSALQNNGSDITELKNKLNLLTTEFGGIEEDINTLISSNKKLEDKIKLLESGQGTGGGTGTITSGAITVSGVTTLFGQPYISFNNLSANSTYSQQFNFNVNNGLSKQINNIQFLVAFQGYDGNNQVFILPTDTVVSVNMMGQVGINWQSQTVGTGMYAFTNVVQSGILSGVGAINQMAGSQTYTVTMTIKTGNTAVNSGFNMYPIVKVLSYN